MGARAHTHTHTPTHKTQNTYTDSKFTSQKQFLFLLERKKSAIFFGLHKSMLSLCICLYAKWDKI